MSWLSYFLTVMWSWEISGLHMILLGIPVDKQLLQVNEKQAYLKQSQQTSNGILKRFARVKTVACTFRFEAGEKGIEYYGSLYSMHHWSYSSVYSDDHIVDKVGSGDCFMAGLIYGIFNRKKEEEIIQFAASAGFGKLFEFGDATNQDIETILTRIKKYA